MPRQELFQRLFLSALLLTGGLLLTGLSPAAAAAEAIHAAKSKAVVNHSLEPVSNQSKLGSKPQQPKQSAQAKPPKRYEAATLSHSSGSYSHPGMNHSPTPIYAMPKQRVQRPIGPGPRHVQTGVSGNPYQHGALKDSSYAPSTGSKNALNPQPIPPGHGVKHAPDTVAPETNSGH